MKINFSKIAKITLAVVVFLNLAVTLIAIVSDNIAVAWVATIIAAIFEYIPFVREYRKWKAERMKMELEEEERNSYQSGKTV